MWIFLFKLALKNLCFFLTIKYCCKCLKWLFSVMSLCNFKSNEIELTMNKVTHRVNLLKKNWVERKEEKKLCKSVIYKNFNNQVVVTPSVSDKQLEQEKARCYSGQLIRNEGGEEINSSRVLAILQSSFYLSLQLFSRS